MKRQSVPLSLFQEMMMIWADGAKREREETIHETHCVVATNDRENFKELCTRSQDWLNTRDWEKETVDNEKDIGCKNQLLSCFRRRRDRKKRGDFRRCLERTTGESIEKFLQLLRITMFSKCIQSSILFLLLFFRVTSLFSSTLLFSLPKNSLSLFLSLLMSCLICCCNFSDSHPDVSSLLSFLLFFTEIEFLFHSSSWAGSIHYVNISKD